MAESSRQKLRHRRGKSDTSLVGMSSLLQLCHDGGMKKRALRSQRWFNDPLNPE